jgi:hypothetical protein
LLNAFTTAFANKDDVELVIKTVGASDYRKVKKRLLHRLPNNIKIQGPTEGILVYRIRLEGTNKLPADDPP